MKSSCELMRYSEVGKWLLVTPTIWTLGAAPPSNSLCNGEVVCRAGLHKMAKTVLYLTCVSHTPCSFLAQEELYLKQMVECTGPTLLGFQRWLRCSSSNHMTGAQQRGVGRLNQKEKDKKKQHTPVAMTQGRMWLEHSVPTRENKIFLVRGSNDFMREMLFELEFPTFYKQFWGSAVRQTLCQALRIRG